MGNVQTVGLDFFPLDEELELLPGNLTPHGHECLVRLGAWIPSFEQAAQLLATMLQINVSEAMSRRRTEAAGAAYVAVQQAEVERLEREMPVSPGGADKVLVSADGAMVPLVGGEWREVKTVAIGDIEPATPQKGEGLVTTTNLSYFSRLAEASDFNRLALGELHRRGVEHARLVAAPNDGAEWIQGFIDYHCPQAIRILDFAHAAQRIAGVGQVIFDPAEAQAQAWLAQHLHHLKHQGPQELLTELRHLHTSHPDETILADNLTYLEKREPQMQYPHFQAQGLPIGSGAIESANKLVVEARLKGAGMHWAPDHVNPMLALRNLVCNDRWEQEWPLIAVRLRQEAAQRRRTLKEKHRAQKATSAAPPVPTTTPPQPPQVKPTATRSQPVAPINAPPSSPVPPSERPPYRPAPHHPWRRSPIGRARYRPDTPNKFSKN
ncbi:MAG: ISKra4 family transposase [Dehalococcoidia bacterium]|nr:MAG: ISKra4 family transposase [Dehalococcoidia bacterium]